MKKVFLLIVSFLLLASTLAFAGYVQGYTRKDGTYVQGHYRSDPNSTVKDNYSYKGNDNPYTGKKGTDYYRDDSSSDYYGTSKKRGAADY